VPIESSIALRPATRSQAPASRGRSFRAFARRILQIRTVLMFRRDPLLAIATLVLAVSVTTPIWATPIMPLVDLGSNIGAASLLDDAAFGHGVVARHYKLNAPLVPYWTVYFVIVVFEHLFGALVAAKLIVGLAVIALPIAIMRLLVACGRSPRLGLWAFMLSWDNNLYWGWITFEFGMVLALFVVAKLIELRSARDALKILPLTFLTGLTHLHSVAWILTCGGLLVLLQRPLRVALLRYALALFGCIVPLVPWAWARLGHTTAGITSAFSFEMHSPQHRIAQLFAYTIDNLPEPGGLSTACAFGLLLFGPALLSVLEQRNVYDGQRWAPVMIFVASAGLYFGLPFAISGPIYHWYTYPRYGVYLLIALLALPRPSLRGLTALALVPGIAIALWVHHGIAAQFAEYGNYVRPYLQIIAAIPKNSRILPVDLDDFRFRGTREAVLGQLHGYAAAETSSFDPHLFDEPNNPLLFREGMMLPHHDWLAQRSFTFEAGAECYDYLIVHPPELDKVKTNKHWSKKVTLVREAGPWRLYKIKAPKDCIAEAQR
jgi:hypothetical protein